MNHNSSKFRLTVNGQDITNGDIDDGRPERIEIYCECNDSVFARLPFFRCPECNNRGYREETTDEYWARVEAMTPKSAEDLL